MSTPRYASVEAYLAAVDPVKARTLRAIIDHLLGRFPELDSKIAWNVPTLHRNGQYVAGVCAYQRHLTFSAWSHAIIAAFRSRLENFTVMKNCFQLPVDWEPDTALLDDLVRARLAELDAA